MNENKPKRFMDTSQAAELRAEIKSLEGQLETKNSLIDALYEEIDYWRNKSHERL